MRYFSTAAAYSGRRLRALHHVEVVGGVREVGAWCNRVLPLAEAPQRADQGRHDRARRQRVVAQLGVVDVVRRAEPERRGVLRYRGSERVERNERVAAPSDRGQHLGNRGRDHAPRRDLGRERLALRDGPGEAALEQQVPHVLERAAAREVDGAVLPVVVEAFEPAHVADGGVGDDEAFEAFRHLVGLRGCGLDLRDAHEVAHRHDADELLTLDDRDVTVAVLGEPRERGARLDVGTDRVGVGGHPLGDLGVRRVGAGGGEADHVALGEDADRAVVVVDHHDGTDALFAHAFGGDGEGFGGLRGDDRIRHDVGDRALARCRYGRVGHRGSLRPRRLCGVARAGRGGAVSSGALGEADRALERLTRRQCRLRMAQLDHQRLVDRCAPLLV